MADKSKQMTLRSNTRSGRGIISTRSTTAAATATTSTATTSSRRTPLPSKITYANASTQTIACPPTHGVKRTRSALKAESPVDCQICWEPIARDGSTPMGFLENCSHVFCASCLVTWNTTHEPDSHRNQRCPVCRSSAKRVLIWPRPFESSKEKDAVVALQKRWVKGNYVTQSDNASSLRNILSDANILRNYMNVTINPNRAPQTVNAANIPDLVIVGRTASRDPRLAIRSRPPTINLSD